MNKISFEKITAECLPILADILNYYVDNTTVTFHTRHVTIDEMLEKVFFGKSHFKAFVIKNGDQVIGYCGVSPWKKQEAYEHTGEVNIYLAHHFVGQGIGSLAIDHLLAYSKQHQITNLIAGVCSENIASIRLFEKAGFQHCAHFQKVGTKFGRVLDTVYLQLIF